MNHHFKDIGAFITNYKQDKQKVTNLVNQYKSLIINNSQFLIIIKKLIEQIEYQSYLHEMLQF